MATTAELALYRQLQKVFKSAKYHLDRCEGELKDSTAAISALLNIAEQFSLAQKVILTETPFAEDFPDVQERLLAKLERAVTNRLSTLQSVVKTFQEAHNKIAKLSSQTFLLYEKYSDQLSVSQVTVTKATIPSISCMLKWTKDIDLKFNEEYVLRSHMVTSFNPQDVSTFEESWMDLSDLHRLVINTAYAKKMSEVIKNVYDYLKILDGAHTEAVKSWDSDSIRKAEHWGLCCEQIYERANGRPWQNDFDNLIRRLSRLPWNIGGLEINFLLLKDARSHVTNALLNNPHYVSDKSIAAAEVHEQLPLELADELFKDICTFDVIEGVLHTVSQSFKLQLLKYKVSITRHSQTENSPTISIDEFTQSQLMLIVRYLEINALDKMLLEETLDEIAAVKGGLLVLVIFLVPRQCLTEDVLKRRFHSQILSLLLECPQHIQRRLWELPVELLAVVLEENAALLDKYISDVNNKFGMFDGPGRENSRLSWSSQTEESSNQRKITSRTSTIRQMKYLSLHGGTNVCQVIIETSKTIVKKHPSIKWDFSFLQDSA